MNDVWGLVRPIIVQEFKKPGEEFTPQVVQPLIDWINTNKPNQLRIAPGYAPLSFSQVTKSEPGPKTPDVMP